MVQNQQEIENANQRHVRLLKEREAGGEEGGGKKAGQRRGPRDANSRNHALNRLFWRRRAPREDLSFSGL